MKTAQEVLELQDTLIESLKDDFLAALIKTQVAIAMEAYADQFKPKWTSVKETLPTDDRWYLCAISGGVLVYACTYSENNNVWHGYGYAQPETRVTHWMALPEPPTT